MASKRERGRPAMALGDLVIGVLLQAMENDQSRDAVSDHQGLCRSGLFVGRPPKAYTLRRSLVRSDVLVVLRWLLAQIAKHVYHLERWYVIDSTYFNTPFYTGWIQVKNSDEKMVWQKVKSAKIFIVRGLVTGVPAACMVTDYNFSDQRAFPILFKQMMEAGAIIQGGGFLGDAGFNAGPNFELVKAHGGRAFFDFDVNSVSSNGEYPHFDEMLKMRHEDGDAWFAVFGQKAAIEATNHELKTLFKRSLRARLEHTREVEALALMVVFSLSLLPRLRLLHKVDLPFVDDRALAFIDEAIAPKRKSKSASVGFEDGEDDSDNVIQFVPRDQETDDIID